MCFFRLENGNFSSSQVISHILGYSAMSLGDDLLQTQPLTMLEVRESTKVYDLVEYSIKMNGLHIT